MSRACIAGGDPARGVEHGELDVFEGGRAGEEVETLEDEAEFLVTQVGALVAVEAGDIDAIEQVAAGSGAVEAAQRVHEGGLAGAGRAHDGDEFAGVHFEADAADGVDLEFAVAVGFADVLELDYGLRLHRRAEG